jgi:hypothetical protein
LAKHCTTIRASDIMDVPMALGEAEDNELGSSLGDHKLLLSGGRTIGLP